LARVKASSKSGALQLAGHLCAERCQQILEGDSSFAKQLQGLGFGRIQINATAANKVVVDPAKLEVYAANVCSCVAAVPQVEFIFQLNGETRGIWSCINAAHPPLPRNISVLFDASCGLGVLATEYPAPVEGVPSGYAGGIGPSNLEQVLAAVAKAAGDVPVWIDMESSLRVQVADKQTPSMDCFSLDKCFSCALTVEPLFT
jgi:hypothetical protein